MTDKGVDFVQFEGFDVSAAASLSGSGRGRQVSGGFVYPIDDGLVMDAQMPCDAPEVETVDVEFEGGLPTCEFVAFVFGLWRVSAVAVLTLEALAATVVFAGFMLAGCLTAGRTSV